MVRSFNIDVKALCDDISRAKVYENPFKHLEVVPESLATLTQHVNSEIDNIPNETMYHYRNLIEVKDTLQNWEQLPPHLYLCLSLFLSPDITKVIGDKFGYSLIPDFGLHGGGLHQHRRGGKLNPHLDYDSHPKIRLQRRLNLIWYCNPKFSSDKGGGQFGLYAPNPRDPQHCGELVKEIHVTPNKLLIFDTSNQAWHGISRPVRGIYPRRSLACFYLDRDSLSHPYHRQVARFSPHPNQRENIKILHAVSNRKSAFDRADNIFSAENYEY